jgi:hypothetical protein
MARYGAERDSDGKFGKKDLFWVDATGGEPAKKHQVKRWQKTCPDCGAENPYYSPAEHDFEPSGVGSRRKYRCRECKQGRWSEADATGMGVCPYCQGSTHAELVLED